MTRREFLAASAALPFARSFVQPGARPGRRVIVLGAGLAGLAAARDLDARGFDVIVVEARQRPGGRVHTLREPFSDGLYAEAGAARIQDSHAFTLRFVKEFGLTLDPFFPSTGVRVSLVGGRRMAGALDLKSIPLTFTEEERRRGFGGCMVHYLFRHLPELGDVAAAGWPDRDLARFEVAIDDFCRAQGASAGIRRLIALGHDLTGMSALQFLRDAALGATTKGWFKVRGGNDLLPRAFAARLVDRIHYGTPVERIAQNASSVNVTMSRGGRPETITADFAVCAIPPGPLRRLDVAPAFTAAKRAAIGEVGGLAMTRVLLQARTRFWLAREENGWGATDDPMDVWDYTRDQAGTRGILGAYTSGRMARALADMNNEARGIDILDRMERLHPGMRAQFEVNGSYSWITDQWAAGAGVLFDAGHLTRHYRHLRSPEGRVHFAGEHTSPWAGWMNGGIESGLRAAAEIAAR